MTLLCQMVQSLGRQMQVVPTNAFYGFAAERSREDYNKMELAMTAKMEEGFRNEQQAREQEQKEIMAGLKNEENAREMVQIDLQAIKDKIRQLESGSGIGGTVGSEVSAVVVKGPSGTFARPPPGVSVQLQALQVQGLTDKELSSLINDLHQMVPEALKKYIDREQTRTEQGTWPTKIMVQQ